MYGLTGFLDSCYEWIASNLWQFVLSVVVFVIVYVVYKFLAGQITRLKEEEKLEEYTAFALNRVLKWIAGLAVVGVIFAQFGIGSGVFAGLFALAGGTIVGFAAINTIGNAIAGIIVMTSRPFKVGDRIFFNGQFADVTAIDLIYTRLKTLDNILVSIPNQELLTSGVDNYGKTRVIRRTCTITAGYELDFDYVEKALLAAANKVKGILKKPKPYVRITQFKDYAVEYTLYTFVNQIRRLREIDADLRKSVFETCKTHKIDISTPSLIRSLNGNGKAVAAQ